MHDVRIITRSIACPFEDAYERAHPPEFFEQWAAGMASSLHRDGDRWVAATQAGQAEVRFSPRNDFGVLDHHVLLPGGQDIYIPLRMIANGDGTEVSLWLFRQPDMDDATFEDDATMVEKDLDTLKALLEG
ncbi:SRPBCC family protein [Sphingomonas montanisoli]|uniref:SRPBCC family protein n=1 Tax=Sphingomonas montanisoli TaxID=2606412 RepID=A0A5D9C902_9SPHN|nr:SRPBCC family protein [Sphingomonas montanisoli]TZG27530.1 SRPBCC family protein [Sphingomonas montanisoli]